MPESRETLFLFYQLEIYTATYFKKFAVLHCCFSLQKTVDSNYELPVAYSVTKASEPDINEAHNLIEKLKEERPEILETCETMEADRGYDDTKLIKKTWDEHKIKLVIDIRSHYIRGKAKMTVRCGIALCVMLAMAVGRIKEKQADKMRSLVRSA